MNKTEWDARFRDLLERGAARDIGDPEPIVERFASTLQRGRALDLACGAGKNALWLAEQGWDVTAVDWSPSAIALVQAAAGARGAKLTTHVANLEKHEFKIETCAWDLILMCRYFQADLFAPAKVGLAPGGILIAIALLEEPTDGNPQSFRVRRGELAAYAGATKGWTILHYEETWRAPENAPGFKATATLVMRGDGTAKPKTQSMIPLVPGS